MNIPAAGLVQKPKKLKLKYNDEKNKVRMMHVLYLITKARPILAVSLLRGMLIQSRLMFTAHTYDAIHPLSNLQRENRVQ